MNRNTRHSTRKLPYMLKRRIVVCWILGFAILAGCNGSDSNGDGGVIGTGIILEGTASENRSFASNSVELRAHTGQRSSTALAANGRFRATEALGSGPYLLRTNLGNNEFRYAMGYTNKISNNHSYSDVIVRTWFTQLNVDIDTVFENSEALVELPSELEYQQLSERIFSLVDPVLASYGLTGDQLLSTSFYANNTGIDNYLDKNPIIISGNNINVVLTDPESNTQSKTRASFALNTPLNSVDTMPPSAPISLRALGSASGPST